MKLMLLFALIGGSVCAVQAQQLERTVLCSTGNYQSHPTIGDLHWTVGEIMVEEFQNGPKLSQGFQQGHYEVISGIGGETSYGELVKVKIFPNPTHNWIQLDTDLSGNLEVVLTDLLGRKIFTHLVVPTNKAIELQPLASGIYLLKVNRKGQTIGNFRIQKVDE